MPFDKVKIDRSFVMDVDRDPAATRLLQSIVQLCKVLGMRTVAEGVETAGQLAALTAMGVDEFQGYHFALPMPVEDWLALLQDTGAVGRQARCGRAEGTHRRSRAAHGQRAAELRPATAAAAGDTGDDCPQAVDLARRVPRELIDLLLLRLELQTKLLHVGQQLLLDSHTRLRWPDGHGTRPVDPSVVRATNPGSSQVKSAGFRSTIDDLT
jgi:hypothetical protein